MLKYDEMNLYTSKRVTHFGCIHCCVEMFFGGILILTVCSCSGSLKTKKATLILPLNFTATTCGLQMELWGIACFEKSTHLTLACLPWDQQSQKHKNQSSRKARVKKYSFWPTFWRMRCLVQDILRVPWFWLRRSTIAQRTVKNLQRFKNTYIQNHSNHITSSWLEGGTILTGHPAPCTHPNPILSCQPSTNWAQVLKPTHLPKGCTIQASKSPQLRSDDSNQILWFAPSTWPYFQLGSLQRITRYSKNSKKDRFKSCHSSPMLSSLPATQVVSPYIVLPTFSKQSAASDCTRSLSMPAVQNQGRSLIRNNK